MIILLEEVVFSSPDLKQHSNQEANIKHKVQQVLSIHSLVDQLLEDQKDQGEHKLSVYPEKK